MNLSFFLISLLSYLTLTTSASAKKYLCHLNETVMLGKNEIAFFESSVYPAYNYIFPTNYCKLNFTLGRSTLAQKLVVVINAIDFNTGHDRKFYVLDNSFSLQSHEAGVACQGFAINEDIKNNCPLESISKNEPFTISDESEMIHIQSTYYKNIARNQSCFWQFNATEQYGFKIIIEILNISPSTKLIIRNSTETVIVDEMVDLYHPYYNRDNYIQIFLSTGDVNFVPEMEFRAYITILKKDFEFVDADCSVDEDGIWSNDYYNGYKSNSRCSYGAVLFPNNGILVEVLKYQLEKNADILKYDIDGQNAVVINDAINFVLENPINATKRYVWFQFISDGSVQQNGFEIRFTNYVCRCKTKTIPCKLGETWSIMEDVDYYCGHLHCTFNFTPCKEKNLQISVITGPEDIFKVYSNKKTILEINASNSQLEDFEIFLTDPRQSMLEITTYPSTLMRKFTMTYTNKTKPGVDIDIILTDDKPYAIINSDGLNLATIEVSEQLKTQNLSFILYANVDYPPIQIYNNKSLTVNLAPENCFKDSHPYVCKFFGNQFALTSSVDVLTSPLYAIKISRHARGCVMKDNIFIAKYFDTNYSVVVLSNSESDCIAKLLIDKDFPFFITSLWTTAVSSNVKIFIGDSMPVLFLEFNSKTATKWNNISLLSPIYSIYVPKNSVFYMTITKFDKQYREIIFHQNVVISQHPFRSVISPPYFTCYGLNFINYIIGDISVRFTTLYYNFSYYFEGIYLNSTESEIIMTMGKSVTLKGNQNVSLKCEMIVSQKNGGALIFVESISKINR